MVVHAADSRRPGPREHIHLTLVRMMMVICQPLISAFIIVMGFTTFRIYGRRSYVGFDACLAFLLGHSAHHAGVLLGVHDVGSLQNQFSVVLAL